MINNIIKTINIINLHSICSFLFLPFLISCSSKQDNVIEIITPPRFPKELSAIPEKTERPQLFPLVSADEKINEIISGRSDPFLPIKFDDALQIPSSFKYYGLISSGNNLSAFVSYEDRSGTVNTGDIGGGNTDLLPLGWTILAMDPSTNVLKLGFEDRSLSIKLFPEK